MSTPDATPEWSRVEAGVRSALFQAGLADVIRDVDAAENETVFASDDDDRVASTPRTRSLALLEAASRHFRDRAAIAGAADERLVGLDRTPVRVRFLDEEAQPVAELPRLVDEIQADLRAADALLDLRRQYAERL